jgi:hypothetical protein
MSSQVSICNLALAALGEKAFIQDINEASVQARYAKLFYTPSRRATLRAHPWNFARVKATLALVTDTGGKWEYAYALPARCLKARYIVPLVPGDKVPFEVALSQDGNSRVLYTNMPDAELVYTYDLENPDLFDPMFVDAFAFGLATRLSPVLAPSKAQEMMTKYVNWMRGAQAADASEGEEEDVATTDWLEARISGGTTYVRAVQE